MKKTELILALIFISFISFAQQQTFDITTFTSPKGWKKQNSESAVQFSKEDVSTGGYCMITVFKENGNINVTVEDDGKGFDITILQKVQGIGWSNIQSRIEYLKGTLDVQSAPGKGTSVHIELNV